MLKISKRSVDGCLRFFTFPTLYQFTGWFVTKLCLNVPKGVPNNIRVRTSATTNDMVAVTINILQRSKSKILKYGLA